MKDILLSVDTKDPEIIHVYARWGEDQWDHLATMFDDKARRLFGPRATADAHIFGETWIKLDTWIMRDRKVA